MKLMKRMPLFFCRHCTFANQDMDATDCDVCGQPRRGAAR